MTLRQKKAVWNTTVVLALAIALTGCGGETGPKRSTIHGKVTYNDEPVADGEISFRPTEETGNAPTTSGAIKNGEYRIDERFGIAAGTYTVHVSSYKPLEGAGNTLPGSDLDRPPGIVVREQLLPEKFNTASTIDRLVVKEGAADIEQNYDLKD